jgi:hypothetical protein
LRCALLEKIAIVAMNFDPLGSNETGWGQCKGGQNLLAYQSYNLDPSRAAHKIMPSILNVLAGNPSGSTL